jgi:hypothetical protein
MAESISKAIERKLTALSTQSFVRASDFEALGSRAAIETTLSRLCRRGELERLEKGLYWKGSHTRFGSTKPNSLALALELTRHRAGGPSGATAAYALSLSTQIPAKMEIAIVGTRPAGRASFDVSYVMRSNPLRATLTPEEIALLELAREGFSRVEVGKSEFRRRLSELIVQKRIVPKRLAGAAAGEPMAVRKALRQLPINIFLAA